MEKVMYVPVTFMKLVFPDLGWQVPVLNVLSGIFHSNEFSKKYMMGTCLV